MLHQGVGANNPEVLREWARVSARQKRRWRKIRDKSGLECMPMNLGPKTHLHIQAFGAKLGCALHYHEAGRIVPLDGGIAILLRTTEHFVNGWQLPEGLKARIGKRKTLAQGKINVADQFSWAATHDPTASFYVVDCGLAFSLLVWICNDDKDFDVVRAQGAHIHKSGDFLSYKRHDFVCSMSTSWVQFID